ncbi:MAG: hypothetical protein WBD42_04100 [Methylovirgula sp.]
MALATRLKDIVGRREAECAWTLQVHASDSRTPQIANAQTLLCEVRFDSFESLEGYILEHKERGRRDKLVMRLPSNAADGQLSRLFWQGVQFLFE